MYIHISVPIHTMPFEFGETINAGADAFLRAPIINTIARSPIYTALVITFIIILIIMFIFRDADTDESLLTLGLRTGFWSFLVTVSLLFLHNKILNEDLRSGARAADIDNVFNGGYNGVMAGATLEDSIVPVTINTNFSPQ